MFHRTRSRKKHLNCRFLICATHTTVQSFKNFTRAKPVYATVQMIVKSLRVLSRLASIFILLQGLSYTRLATRYAPQPNQYTR